jgi:aminoglycoside/choline kinase family phosphotransferase
MTTETFVKHYSDQHTAEAAAVHRKWLAGLNSGVRIPQLRAVQPGRLVFEHLGDRHLGPADLDAAARALGRIHAAAHTHEFHAASLDQPYTAPGLTITDFITPRAAALHHLPLPTAGRPVAFYKDANIRNFLRTDDGIALVDFDDLTLAPFGYDLAKLIISTAMTFGQLTIEQIDQARELYNTEAGRAGAAATCTVDALRLYCEFHHHLTARYLHRNGYRHPWPHVRPWPVPQVIP